MSFRENMAWTMAVVLTLAGGFYAWEMIGHWIAIGQAPAPSLKVAAVFLVVVIGGSIIASASLAGFSSAEADAPADERERVIIDRAGNWSGYVVGGAAVFAAIHYLYHGNGNLMFQVVVMGLIVGSIADYVFQIVLFRRGI